MVRSVAAVLRGAQERARTPDQVGAGSQDDGGHASNHGAADAGHRPPQGVPVAQARRGAPRGREGVGIANLHQAFAKKDLEDLMYRISSAILLTVSLIAAAWGVESGVNWLNGTGEPSMCVVNNNTAAYSSYPINTAQLAKCDPSGAQFSNQESLKGTYSVATVAYAPYTSAADIAMLCGSSSATVRATRVALSGRSTSASQIDVSLIKRSTADTGGSQSSLTAVPHDSIDAAATASAVTFGAAPTAGTTVGTIRAQQANLSAAGSGGATTPFEWDFGVVIDKSIVLRGTGQCLALNLGGGAVPAGTVLNIFMEWTEE
jgi:hypothetical protein